MKNQFASLVKFMQIRSSFRKKKFCTNFIFKKGNYWYAMSDYAIVKFDNFDVVNYKFYVFNKMKKQKSYDWMKDFPKVFIHYTSKSKIMPVLMLGEPPRFDLDITEQNGISIFDEDKIYDAIQTELEVVLKCIKYNYGNHVCNLFYDLMYKDVVQKDFIIDQKENKIQINTNVYDKHDNYLITNTNLESFRLGVEIAKKQDSILSVNSRQLHDGNIYEVKDENNNHFMWIMGNK